MPLSHYRPGDICYLNAEICNPGSESGGMYPLFVILDVFGEYWFWPSWVHHEPPDFQIDYREIELKPGLQLLGIIPPFPWPSGAGSLSGIVFWGALTNREITDILGVYDRIEWSYGQ